MEQLLVLDLETLPDLDAGRALLGEAASGLDMAALRAALGARYAREGQDPATTFLKPVLHRICVVGVLRAEREGPQSPWQVTRIRARSTDELSEAEMLAGLETSFRQQPVLVGFNTMGFDLPVLRYRALALGVAMPALLGPRGQGLCLSLQHRAYRHVRAAFGLSRHHPALAGRGLFALGHSGQGRDERL